MPESSHGDEPQGAFTAWCEMKVAVSKAGYFLGLTVYQQLKYLLFFFKKKKKSARLSRWLVTGGSFAVAQGPDLTILSRE